MAYAYVAPQGKTVDTALAEKVTALAKDMKLDQAGAQRLYDAHTTLLDAKYAEADAHVTQWKAEAAADPEIGGEKAATVAVDMEAAITKFGTPHLKALLEYTRLDSHPEIRRMLARVGKLTKEDTTVRAAPGAAPPQSIAERMYPNLAR